MKTLQERYMEALIKREEKEVKKTFKYIVLSAEAHKAYTTAKHFYLGRSGSLRAGNTIASSVPVHASFKQKLLEQVGIL